MKTRYSAPMLAALLSLVFAGTGCELVRAKAAFKDGNKLYREENFKKAVDAYERGVTMNPTYAEAWFYLGSSHQALYRPGKPSPVNQERLQKAIDAYKKSLETNNLSTENLKKVKFNALGALTERVFYICGPPKIRLFTIPFVG